MPAAPRRLGSPAARSAPPSASGWRSSRTKLWLGVLGLGLLAAAVAPGVRGYAALRHFRWLRAAQAAFSRGDLQTANWTARRVLERDPTNLRATLLLAETATRLSSRDAIHWRARMVELEPDNSANLLAWSQSALDFNDLSTATIALSRVPEAARNSVAFSEVAATLALAENNPDLAARHLAAGAALEPHAPARQLRLACVQLQTGSELVRSEGRAVLDHLRGNPQVRTEALSALAREALENGRKTEALEASRELLFWNSQDWSPRLLRAEVLRAAQTNAFPKYLTELMGDVAQATHPAHLAQLLNWMSSQDLAAEALAWVKSLPPELATNPPVAVAIAELHAVQNDWLGLSAWTRSSNWGRDEPFRFAYEARAENQLPAEQRRPNVIDSLWNKALKLANRDPAQLERLAQFSVAWNLSTSIEPSWWAVAEAAADPEPALLHLATLYQARGDSVGRFRAAKRLLEFRPDDRFAQNETAYLGLLLGIDDPDPHPLAERLRHRPPMRPEAVVTYAFSLWRRHRIREAVGAFDVLPVAIREEPALAWFYGAILAESGDFAKARRYLALGSESHRSTEEEALYRAARQRSGSR